MQNGFHEIAADYKPQKLRSYWVGEERYRIDLGGGKVGNSDGYVVICGDPKWDNQTKRSYDGSRKLSHLFVGGHKPSIQIEPIGYWKGEGKALLVLFDNGSVIDKQFFDGVISFAREVSDRDLKWFAFTANAVENRQMVRLTVGRRDVAYIMARTDRIPDVIATTYLAHLAKDWYRLSPDFGLEIKAFVHPPNGFPLWYPSIQALIGHVSRTVISRKEAARSAVNFLKEAERTMAMLQEKAAELNNSDKTA